MTAAVALDPHGVQLALRAPEPLAAFNRAGILAAADVHVALRLARLGDAAGDEVRLAVALAVRAPRTGHVFVDLARVAAETPAGEETDVDPAALPWPEPEAWVAAVAAADGLVARGDEDDRSERGPRPVRLVGTRLYLDRYWREERTLAAALRGFAGSGIRSTSIEVLRDGLARLFPDAADTLQRAAAACAVLRGISVVAGGPGTGKTTTVARISALLAEQAAAAGEPAPLIALCAPTGKAAARLEEAVREEAGRIEVAPVVREALGELRASTIHRLLGWRPGSHSRFRHDAGNRLPHDVVIVDETSMVGLSLMARLLEAVRSDARVVLVGDPDQLTAIEAGAVLRDIVGPAVTGPRMTTGTRALLARLTGAELPGEAVAATPGSAVAGFGDGVVVLERGHRFGAGIGAVAAAIRRGEADALVRILREGDPDEVRWIDVDAAGAGTGEAVLAELRAAAVSAGAAVVAAARAGDAPGALAALGRFRLLCAHRRGPHGVSAWTGHVERWLAGAVPGFVAGQPEYAGRPVLITENDYELGVFNGDTGVVVTGPDGRLTAVFERERGWVAVAPARLGPSETLHALTIHRSQGSQFDTAAVLLPDAGSRILTRELLYTAVTRARRRLVLVGDEAAVRAAVQRPVSRASGLRERLWTEP